MASVNVNLSKVPFITTKKSLDSASSIVIVLMNKLFLCGFLPTGRYFINVVSTDGMLITELIQNFPWNSIKLFEDIRFVSLDISE